MLRQENTLPGAKGHFAIIYWDSQTGVGYDCSKMRGGVIRSFTCMAVPAFPFWGDMFQEIFHVMTS
jgi:hypothetical protein